MANIAASSQETIQTSYVIENTCLNEDGIAMAMFRVIETGTGAVIRKGVIYISVDGIITDENRNEIGVADPGDLAVIQGVTQGWNNVFTALVSGSKVKVAQSLDAAAVANLDVVIG